MPALDLSRTRSEPWIDMRLTDDSSWVWQAWRSSRPPTPPLGSDDLRKGIGEIADGIKSLLDGRGEDSISVGQFNGPLQLASSSGPAIVKVLGEELKKKGVKVKVRASLGIRGGTYKDVEDPRTGKVAAMVKAKVVDRSGETLVNLEQPMTDAATVSTLLGLTVPIADPVAQDQELRTRASTSRRPTWPRGKRRIKAAADEEPLRDRDPRQAGPTAGSRHACPRRRG